MFFARLPAEGHLAFDGVRGVCRRRDDPVCEEVEIESFAPPFQVHRTRGLYARAFAVSRGLVLSAVPAYADLYRFALPVLTLDGDAEREGQERLPFLSSARGRLPADRAAHRNIAFNHGLFVF